MTWQGSGAGGTGGTGGPGDPGGQPSEPDDATRVDWPSAPPAGQPPAASEPPPDPFAPGGPLHEPAAAPADVPAPPPPMPVSPAPADAPPPASAVPPVLGSPTEPWAPAPQAGGSWAAPPMNAGGQYAVPGAPGLVYAGAIPRAAAWLVDSFILGIIGAIIAIPFAASAVPAIDPTTGQIDYTRITAARGGISGILTVAIEAVYFIYFWTSNGRRTLGMRLFGLQIGDFATGNKLELQAAVKRWLAYGSWLALFAVIPGVAAITGLASLVWTLALLATTASSPTKQGLHDKLAGSAVVRPASAGNGLAITCLVLVFLLPFLLLFLLVPLIFLGGQVSEILSAVGESV